MSKVAVVTGANKGIGFAIVKNLAPQIQGTVYLTSRNEELGKKALTEIKNLGISNVKYQQLDITDQKSIDRFAKYIKDTHGGLDVLINNAAIGSVSVTHLPADQAATEMIRVNFTSTLNVSHALFPLLKTHARVVNVASTLGQLHNIKNKSITDKLSSDKATEHDIVEVMNHFIKSTKEGTLEKHGYPTTPWGSYTVSKIGLIAVTKAHQRLFDKEPRRDILVNSLCPGYVDTDMSQHKGTLTVDQGSETPILLALVPENSAGPRGEFYSQKKPAEWGTKDVFDATTLF